ncbi:hypothetical protein EPIR_1229 [Erwinia piriflorinigrans CFBP 5888]|uniref:Uncharacterized protein n=1 Tax=Erwinia piriflorinigrans CFBP 5888 TaxID=1161919 RepID=V5Z6J5_9GAMM|nr:hypothetical protein EPIR_1229 [Erwinia piriflorinigrans CFBP 5888]
MVIAHGVFEFVSLLMGSAATAKAKAGVVAGEPAGYQRIPAIMAGSAV